MRDYSKFLKDDGRFYVRYVPRSVYTKMITEYRQQPTVIGEVFHGLYWLWDLEETERKLGEAGQAVDRAAIAQKILGEMDDTEWWEAMRAFETHFQEHFQENPAQWSSFLDPVYDEQEEAGWVDCQ